MTALILTRPEPAGHETARAARTRRWPGPILFSPALRIVPERPPRLPDGQPVFTSANAVTAVTGWLDLSSRAVIAVGPATAAAAARAGARPEILGGDARALAIALAARGGGPFVHLHGRHVAMDLVAALRGAGLPAEGAVVYDQLACPLTHAAHHALTSDAPAVLPLFSPRTARIVADQLDRPPPATRVVAISARVAADWPWGEVALVASESRANAVLERVLSVVGDASGS